jgi:nicotinamide mononucleotide transporter
MFLQVFFFVTNMMGWWQWKFPKTHEANLKNELKITYLDKKQIIFWTFCGIFGTILMGSFSAKLHEWFSMFFSKPSAFPYLDSFTTVMSIIATFLMIRKKIECWLLWLLIDVISTYMYFVKDVKLYSLLYFVFCFMALLGFLNWKKEYR